MQLKTFNLDYSNIKLVNIGDVHFGNPNCDRDGLQKIVNMINKETNMFWISTGDLLEVAIEGTIGDIYKSNNLQEELEGISNILKPIKDKCLGIVGSNHHDRLEKKTGLNLDRLLTNWIGIPYLGYFGFIRIVLNGIGFFICMHHGYGGGRTQGAKTNTMAQVGNIAKGFDLYLSGHTHSYSVFTDVDYILDKKHYRVSEIIAYYICTGHFLDYCSSYAERKALKPKPKCCACINLEVKDNQSKNISVEQLTW